VNDMLADSILVMITQLQSIPKESEHRCCHSWPKKKAGDSSKDIKVEDEVASSDLLEAKRKEMILELLRPQFREIHWDPSESSTLVVVENSKEFRLDTSNLDELEVRQCGGEEKGKEAKESDRSFLPPLSLEERFQRAFLRAYYAVYPLS
jgi:hypothetical protein